MKKKVNKFTKILLLISMIFSDLMTPIKVLADVISEVEPNKGDIGINNTVSGDGNSVTVSTGSYEAEGDVLVTKTVSKTETTGRYRVDFNVKGKELTNQIEVTKPIYLVVVFDTSGSMICDASEDSYAYSSKREAENANGYWDTDPVSYTATIGDGNTIWCNNANAGKNVLSTKWENAVNGATNFSTSLAGLGNETYISLVTFAGSASTATNFVHGSLNDDDFGHPIGSTNLKQGLANAKAKLDTVTDQNAQKYILVIGDGAPTAGGGYGTTATEAAKNQADTIKNAGIKIFAIGYGVDNDVDAQEVLKYISSCEREITTDRFGNETITYKDDGYYQSASSEDIDVNLQLVFNELGTPKKAGTDAIITDGIGNNFTVVHTDDEDITVSENGTSVEINIGDIISGDGTTKTFYVDIDPNADSDTGWHNVNSGFSMSYSDNDLDANKDGIADTSTIVYGDNIDEDGTANSEKDPEVYWNYDFVVNYYKDEITNTGDSSHYLGSKSLDVTHGSTVTESDLDLTYLLPVGYEFVSGNISPTSVLVDKVNNDVQVINVLYTIKKFDYVVNYYYADVNNNYSNTPDSSTTYEDIEYGTVVTTSDYYLGVVKEGYTLDGDKTNNENSVSYTITDNNVVIDIYYKRNNYSYTVKYHFDNKIDSDFTKNNNAIYGSIIYAENNYLKDSDLVNKENEDSKDYFIDPSNSNNISNITIGTGNNELNIYYISTSVTDEDMVKTSDTNKITSGDTPITYTVVYTSKVNNVKEGDTVKVVVTDTLPLEIDESKSNLNGGVYDSSSKTVTWTFETTMKEFVKEFDASKTISYTVVYKNVGNGDGSTLTNNVIGNTTAGGKTTTGKGDSTDVEVEIPGKVTAIYVDESDVELAGSVTTNGLVGESYTTSAKDILGYTLKGQPSNKNGVYTEEDIIVKYIYTKNDGVIEEPKVVKTAPNNIDSVDSVFDYTINATGEIKDYVGKVTIKVVDTLPYAIDEEESTLDNRCTYDGNRTITCIEEYDIADKDYTVNNDGEKVFSINEIFNLSIKYNNIDSETVVNTAKSVITLEKVTEDSEPDEVITIVEKGKVTAIYVEDGNEDNILADSVTTEGLVGTDYTTSAKDIFGYTLVEEPSNKNGKYTKEDITVKYLYTKNDGVVDEPTVEKIGPGSVDSINEEFDYTIKASGEVRDYVGKVKLEVVDTLPYKANIISKDNRCTYDNDKTITCTVEYDITDKDYIVNSDGEKVFSINEIFNIKLVYVNIDSDEVINNVTGTITLDKVNNSDSDNVVTEVYKGNVIATYKDTDGNELHENVELGEKLAGTEYTTEEKLFFGYELVEVPSNKEGEYLANQTIYVDYVYRRTGTIDEDDTNIIKIGPETVESINSVFDYAIKVSSEIKDYVGDVTIKVVDSLPYAITEESINKLSDECIYNSDDKTITCVRMVTIDEDNYTTNNDGEKVYVVNEIFTLELEFVGIDSDIVTNNAKVEIILDEVDKKYEEEADPVDTKVLKGNVVVTYKDIEGNRLHEDVQLGEELGGTEYTTLEKEFYGYTLLEVPSNKDGLYIAEETIYVDYIYNKNIGTSEEELVKIGVDVVDNIDSMFDYTIRYETTIKDYIGETTLVITDELPYVIDEEKSIYNKENCEYTEGNLVCTYTKNITEEDNIFVIEEDFTLYYVGIDSNKVTNKVNSVLTYGESIKINDSEYTSEVKMGTVIVNYVTIDGTKLTDSIIITGLVGESYTTDKKVFDSYNFVRVDGEVEGNYTEDTIEVTYVYDLVVMPPKTGLDMNMFMFIKYLVFAIIIVVSGKTYKLIKNN